MIIDVSLVLAQDSTAEFVTGVLAAIQPFLEYLGTIAFAISGVFAAARSRMDIGGGVVLGAIVAVGGGSLRDMALGRTAFWVTDPSFLAIGIAAAIVMSIPVFRRSQLPGRRVYWVIELFDAVGLALFVVAGVNIAIDAGANYIAAAVLGILSGIGGGVLRDLLTSRVPTVLADGRLYMAAALAGALTYIALLQLPVSPALVLWIPIVVILGLRLASLRYNVTLPQFNIDDPAITKNSTDP